MMNRMRERIGAMLTPAPARVARYNGPCRHGIETDLDFSRFDMARIAPDPGDP